MSGNQIKQGAIISYLSIFINFAITFFYTPWMIRQIGIGNYGLYSLVGSFLSYFMMDLGLTGTVQRYVAKFRAENNLQKISNVLGLVIKLYLCIDAVILIVLSVLYFFLSGIFKGLSPEEIETLKVLYIIAGGFSILGFAFSPINGAMLAYEYFVESKALDMFNRVGSVLLIVVVLLLGRGVYEMVLIIGLIGFLTSLFKFIVFKKKSKIVINWQYFDRAEVKILFSFSVWVFIISLAQAFRLTFMPSLLGIFSNSTEISIFSLGMVFEAYLFIISSALSGLFLPKVSRLLHDDDQSRVQELMTRVGRLQLYIVSPIIIGFVIIGDSFLNLWVGEKFAKTYYVVLFLIATNLISLTQSIANDVVLAANKVKVSALAIFVSSVISLSLAIFLAPEYGAVGCALAFFLGMLLNLILQNIIYVRKLQLNVLFFFREVHLKVLPTPIIVGGFCFLCSRFLFGISNWLDFALFCLVFVLLYILGVYLFVLTPEEKSLFRVKAYK